MSLKYMGRTGEVGGMEDQCVMLMGEQVLLVPGQLCAVKAGHCTQSAAHPTQRTFISDRELQRRLTDAQSRISKTRTRSCVRLRYERSPTSTSGSLWKPLMVP